MVLPLNLLLFNVVLSFGTWK